MHAPLLLSHTRCRPSRMFVFAVALLILAAAACCPALCTSASAQSSHPDDALDQMRSQKPLNFCLNWLIALDSGNPAATYNLAADVFKKNMTTDVWAATVSKLRKSYGKTLTRTARSCQFLDKVEGMPPGKYIVVFYITSFDKYKFISEKVLAVEDGETWRVCDWAVMNEVPKLKAQAKAKAN